MCWCKQVRTKRLSYISPHPPPSPPNLSLHLFHSSLHSFLILWLLSFSIQFPLLIPSLPSLFSLFDSLSLPLLLISYFSLSFNSHYVFCLSLSPFLPTSFSFSLDVSIFFFSSFSSAPLPPPFPSFLSQVRCVTIVLCWHAADLPDPWLSP